MSSDHKYNTTMNFTWLVIYISLGYSMGIKGCAISSARIQAISIYKSVLVFYRSEQK